MNSNAHLKSMLKDLGLQEMADGLDDVLAHAIKKRLRPEQALEMLVMREVGDRQTRSLERRTKRARVGNFTPIVDYDWSFPTEIDRALVERALELRFIDEGANIILVGPHGVGKTTILQNICHNAVNAGHTVLVTTASELIHDLTSTDSPSKLRRRISYYARIAVLAIDELGYLSYDDRAADLIFQIVSARHKMRKPMLLTTNLAFADWPTVFPNATCTVALVDRVTHHADVVKIAGESWRKKEAKERSARSV